MIYDYIHTTDKQTEVKITNEEIDTIIGKKKLIFSVRINLFPYRLVKCYFSKQFIWFSNPFS